MSSFQNEDNKSFDNSELDTLLASQPNIVKIADYWIIRSRVAARKDDVQGAICNLEQAHVHEAQVS